MSFNYWTCAHPHNHDFPEFVFVSTARREPAAAQRASLDACAVTVLFTSVEGMENAS